MKLLRPLELIVMPMQDSLMKFDPKDGRPEPYPSHAEQYRIYHGSVAWLINPWTGRKRKAEDIGTDCFGYAIVPPGGGYEP